MSEFMRLVKQQQQQLVKPQFVTISDVHYVIWFDVSGKAMHFWVLSQAGL